MRLGHQALLILLIAAATRFESAAQNSNSARIEPEMSSAFPLAGKLGLVLGA